MGELQSHKGKEAVLTNARRIWSWQGAKTLHEIANSGVGNGSRVSVSVARIELTEVIEVLTCTKAGESNLRDATWQ